jgi:hypothetical protein
MLSNAYTYLHTYEGQLVDSVDEFWYSCGMFACLLPRKL